MPIDVRALINAGAKLLEDRDLPVKLVVLVEIDAPDALLEAVKAELRPRSSNALVDVAVIEPGMTMRVDSSVDAVIVLLGSGSHDVVPTLAELRRKAIPAAAVALRESAGELPKLIEHPILDVITGTDAAALVPGRLADWIMEKLPRKRTAIAHNFAFVRHAVAKEAVRATAWQNALIGAASIIPGTDMPFMTLNQGKMLLQIAAAYGEQLGAERIRELAAIVGGGFLFRAFARQALDLIPGFGWAIKGGIAYTGTIAMGEAAIKYFEEGADVGQVARKLRESAVSTMRKAKGRLPKREKRPAALPHHEYLELPAPDPHPAGALPAPAPAPSAE